VLSVAVICMEYAAGSGASAIVEHFRAEGYACEVVCPLGDEPAPAHAESGRVRVHRIALRRGTGEIGFAAQAARRVYELWLGGRCDRVVCLDACWCTMVLRCMGLGNTLEIQEWGRAPKCPACIDRWRSLEAALDGRGAEALA